MYTLCSHCQAEYEVAPELLVRGRGWLHCSACEREFDALGNLTKTPRSAVAPPPALPSQAHEKPSGAEPDAAPLAAEGEPAAALPVEEMPAAADADDPALAGAGPPDARAPVPDEAAAPVVETPAPALRSAPAPSFAKGKARLPVGAVRRGRGWRWAAIAALAALLVVQVALADRGRFAADARTRPWLEKLCAALACELPAWREPSAMQLMARDVRPHPSVPDALIISASFRNEARWAQPWPDLNLTLSDINGQAIAQRQFEPDEYLGLGARELTIEPGQTASVTLEVADPGKQAVAFEFEFR